MREAGDLISGILGFRKRKEEEEDNKNNLQKEEGRGITNLVIWLFDFNIKKEN